MLTHVHVTSDRAAADAVGRGEKDSMDTEEEE